MSELAGLGEVVDRVPLAGHVGKSGARLERVRTADGASYVVKRITAESDLLHALLGGGPGREYLLWREGALDRLARRGDARHRGRLVRRGHHRDRDA
jgi:hypothetical protein